MIKVFLTNLGKYNEGYLIGEWLELPATQEQIDETMAKIGINEEYEEYFITDYETNINIESGEYSNIDELNKIADELESLNEDDDIIRTILSYTNNIQETIDIINRGDYIIYWDCDDMVDVAYQIVEEYGYLNNVPEQVKMYFDYEAFARDLGIGGNFEALDNSRYIQIL